MKKFHLLGGCAVLFILLISIACVADKDAGSTEAVVKKATLEIVKERGELLCGVTTGVPGYSAPDSSNVWRGFDVDVCRAVSAAIFGDADKVVYKPLSAKERFTALASGEIDMLSRVTTWTTSRDTTLGLNFAGVAFYDGQGFMVKKSSNIKGIKELAGASICVQSGTTTEQNLTDYFKKHSLDFNLITYDRNEQASAALEEGRCDATTSDASQLYALRTKFSNPEDFVIFDELISKEPLGPVVPHGDDQWLDIVKWALLVLINAEEEGITSANVDSMKSSNNPVVKRILGIEGDLGQGLGLDNNWSYNIIKLVGNYEEIFEKNLGADSPLNISRGYNALWFNGGLQYGYPMR